MTEIYKDPVVETLERARRYQRITGELALSFLAVTPVFFTVGYLCNNLIADMSGLVSLTCFLGIGMEYDRYTSGGDKLEQQGIENFLVEMDLE